MPKRTAKVIAGRQHGDACTVALLALVRIFSMAVGSGFFAKNCAPSPASRWRWRCFWPPRPASGTPVFRPERPGLPPRCHNRRRSLRRGPHPTHGRRSPRPGPQSRGGRSRTWCHPAHGAGVPAPAAPYGLRCPSPCGQNRLHDQSFNFSPFCRAVPADDGAGHPQAIDGGTHDAARISGALAAGIQSCQLGAFKIFFPLQPHRAAGTGLEAGQNGLGGGVTRNFPLVSPQTGPQGVGQFGRQQRTEVRSDDAPVIGGLDAANVQPAPARPKSSGCSPPGQHTLRRDGLPHRPGLPAPAGRRWPSGGRCRSLRRPR